MINCGTLTSPVGFRRIKKPNEELKTYIKTRLKYEILQYGLRGSTLLMYIQMKWREKVVDNFVNNNILNISIVRTELVDYKILIQIIEKIYFKALVLIMT